MGMGKPVRVGRWGFAVMLAALPMGSCLFETATPPGESVPSGEVHDLHYVARVENGGRECQVEIRLLAWPEGAPRILQAPLYHPDNPVMPVRGLTAADLVVKDGQGLILAARDTVLSFPNLDGNFITLPRSAHTVSYQVDLDPEDDSRFGLPVPAAGEGVSLIDGAYFFMLPLVGGDYATQWRSPVRLSLDFVAGEGNVLLGAEPSQTFVSNYELMFVRGVLNPLTASTFIMRGHEVTTYTTSFSPLDLGLLNSLLERCIRVVEDSILPLPTYRYHVGENPVFWGIEGVQGYWFRPEAANDVIMHIHELVHTFVGVFHSEIEDPWWKEGVTSYVAELLAVQSGLWGDAAFAASMLHLRDTLPAAMRYALASPHVRENLFRPLDSTFGDPGDPEGFFGLVYGKGSQAAMIMDRYLLEGSGGKYSIYDLIRELIRKHGTGFRRPELVSAVDSLAGGRSEEFLAGLLDQASPLGADSLARTYVALRSMGRFGPGGGLDPIPGLDGAASEPATGALKNGSRGGVSFDSRESAGSGTRKVPPGAKF